MQKNTKVNNTNQKEGNVMNNNPTAAANLPAKVVVPSLENRKETR